MKKLKVLAIAFLVFFSITMNAEALESKMITRQNSASAFASWSEGTLYYMDLYISETNKNTYIYVEICRKFSCAYGEMYTQKDVLDISMKLDKATLSPVEMTVWDYYYDTSEKITIQAEWRGVGKVIKGSSHAISKLGDMTFKYSDSTNSRDALAIGSMNGNDLKPTKFAGLSKSKLVSMTMEK